MSKQSISLITIIAIVVIAAATWYLYENIGKVDGDPWEMIPNNAALIIEIDNPRDVSNKFNDSNLIWQKLLQIRNVEKFEKYKCYRYIA